MGEKKSEFAIETCPECRQRALVAEEKYEMDMFPEDDGWGYAGTEYCCTNCDYKIGNLGREDAIKAKEIIEESKRPFIGQYGG